MIQPSVRFIWGMATNRAKGLRPLFMEVSPKKCFICGAKDDYIFEWVKLYGMVYQGEFKYFCNQHGRVVTYNIFTGDKLELPNPKPMWLRKIQKAIIQTAFISRLLYFFVRDWILWQITEIRVWYYSMRRKNDSQ